MGLGHRAACCRTPVSPIASSGSLVGRGGVQETPGLVTPHWWVNPVPETSPGPLAGRAKSWGLAVGAQVSQSWCQTTVGWGRFLTQLAVRSGLSQSLCWPASWQGQGPAGPELLLAHCWEGLVCRLQGCDCPVAIVCPLVCEAGRESRACTLEVGARNSGAGAYPHVGRAGSWGLWLQGSGGPGLILAHWCMGPSLSAWGLRQPFPLLPSLATVQLPAGMAPWSGGACKLLVGRSACPGKATV